MHISDQELLQSADGELNAHDSAWVHAHLEACWSCRARMAEMEETIVDLTKAYHKACEPQLPPIANARAQLRARLVELGASTENISRPWFFRYASARAVVLCVALLPAALACVLFLKHLVRRRTDAAIAAIENGAIPNRGLTPGATRSVSIGDVCSMPHEEVVKEVSASLRQKVLQEYGIRNAPTGDYEIDYLIAPGLGGTEDIHNLWPEPYQSHVWNARVKDALEERLHQMVCAHQLDLNTAQHDISSDWIAAYRKYFHTNMPLSPDVRSVAVSYAGFFDAAPKLLREK